MKAKKKFVKLPKGDVISTNADNSALYSWIGFKPSITIEEGMEKFLEWFKSYY